MVFALLNDMNKPKPKAPAGGGDVGGHGVLCLDCWRMK